MQGTQDHLTTVNPWGSAVSASQDVPTTRVDSTKKLTTSNSSTNSNSCMYLVLSALRSSTVNFTDRPSNLSPVNRTRFVCINGTLVSLLLIRHNICKEAIQFCACPTFTFNSAAFTSGVTIYAAADSSLVCHCIHVPFLPLLSRNSEYCPRPLRGR